MKKIYTLILVCVLLHMNAQVVSIGTGINTYTSVPYYYYGSYNYAQSIYLASEINQTSGTLYRIKYKGATNITSADNWTVYVGNTTKTSFSSSSDWVDVSTLTQVFSGTVDIDTSDNTITIEFDAGFSYTGSNLVIAVDENNPDRSFSASNLYNTSKTNAQSIYDYDNSDIDPSSPPSGSTTNYAPTIDLDFNATACNELATNLGTSTISNTTADLTWTAGGSISNWNVEYGTTGFTQGTGTTVSASTNSYNVTGLSAYTSYDYYVQTNCGSGTTSAWVGPFTFTTLCDGITSFPYAEEYEGITTGQPDCWNIAGSTTSNSYHFSSYSSGYNNRGMRFNSYNNSSGRTSELISPTYDLSSLQTAQLSFYFKNPTGGDFEVLISSDGGATYTSLENNLTGQSEWLEKSYDITSYKSDNVRVKFIGTSNYGSGDAYIYLDAVKINEVPSCMKPTELSSSNITGVVSVDLAWTANNNPQETQWDIEYGESGFSQGDGTTVTVSENPYTLSNIAQNTTFDFYIRAKCTNGDSDWSDSSSFTTSDQTVPIELGVGINTENPKTTLDVRGPIMSTTRNDALVYYECNAEIEGAFGYDKETNDLKVCTKALNSDEYVWRALRYGNN